MLAICTYSLERCSASEVIDVVQNHQFALIKRDGVWEKIERSDIKQSKRQLEYLASFPAMNPNPIFEVDLKGQVTFMNESGKKRFLDLLAVGVERQLFPDWKSIVRKVKEAPSGYLVREADVGDASYYLTLVYLPENDHVRIYALDISHRKHSDRLDKAHVRIVTQASTGVRSMNEVMQIVLDEIESLTESKISFYHFVESDQKALVFQAWSTNTLKHMCASDLRGAHYPVSKAGVWADAVRKRRPVIHNNYSSLSNRKGLPKGHVPVVRELVVPIMRGNKLMALMGIGNKPTDYTDADIRIVSQLGDLSWEMVNRKRAEELLKRSEAQYRSLFENMLEGFAYCKVLYDESGTPSDFTYLHVNKAFEKLTGLKNVVGKDVSEVIPGIQKSNPELFEIYGAAAMKGRSQRFETYIEPLKMWLAISVYGPEKDHFVAVFDNITERKEAEEDLRESEQRLKHAQEIAHLGSWELDILKNRLTWSDEVYRIFGLKPQEFDATYETFLEAVHPDDRAPVDNAYTGSIRDGRDAYEIEHRIVRGSTGEVRIVQERCQHFRDASGRIVKSVGMVHDVTERKKAEQMKDELIGMVSHELKTPLTVIIGALSVALSEGVSADQARDLIQDATINAESLASIVDNLLELSRYQSDKLILETNPTNIEKTLEEVIEKFFLRTTKHTLLMDIPPRLPEAAIDPVRIDRVLHNLIENAVKYSPDGGDVKVSASKHGSHIVVSVSDEGIGISHEDQERLFKRFQRIETSGKSRTAGVGLGLRVCRMLVEAHGGQIWVESTPRKGSTFRFTVPIADSSKKTRSS